MRRETFIDVLTERKDLIENAVIEAIEDIRLGIAMEEGRTGEYIAAKEFIKKLDGKIKNAKSALYSAALHALCPLPLTPDL